MLCNSWNYVLLLEAYYFVCLGNNRCSFIIHIIKILRLELEPGLNVLRMQKLKLRLNDWMDRSGELVPRFFPRETFVLRTHRGTNRRVSPRIWNSRAKQRRRLIPRRYVGSLGTELVRICSTIFSFSLFPSRKVATVKVWAATKYYYSEWRAHLRFLREGARRCRVLRDEVDWNGVHSDIAKFAYCANCSIEGIFFYSLKLAFTWRMDEVY